ncbi:hypothetical protein GY45DRAFT_1320196 [Cubamyces sp. BRFM 1775]|nr:hypothetical protein GY45DRAFT_1320196 [Cubamyces sp. BRFM 1775]
MTSPYSTPRYPGAPNPTPRSTQKALRPPIFNPYDKFTQPEFDAWITDITGALKRALGKEDAPPAQERAQPTSFGDDTAEEGVEDSFAEVRARRLAKGKERARDEDFEQEEVQAESGQDEDEEQDGWGEPFDDAQYSSGESKEASPEVIELLSDDGEPDADAKQASDDDAEEEAEGEEAEDEAEAEYDEEDQEEDVHSEDAQGSPRSSPFEEPSHPTESYAHEVTEILDSDEEPEEAEVEEGEEHRVLPARFQRKPDIVAPARLESDDEEEYEDELDEEQAEEQANPFPPPTERREPVDIDDPWRGPATYAEDFYAGGDVPTSTLEHKDPHTLPTEDDELPVDEAAQTPDLPDPWEGPRTFAEDFYAGGDALLTRSDGATPSHLTPKDEGPIFIPGVTDYSESHDQRDAEVDSRQTTDTDSHKAAVVAAPEASVDVVQDDGGDPDEADLSDADRSPSPPSATLRTHVDWNWPPAFPGRVATGPGHIVDSEREVFEISDDDEDEDDDDSSGFNGMPTQMPTQMPIDRPAKAVEPEATAHGGISDEQAPLSVDPAGGTDMYADFDELYDMAAEGTSYNTQGSFEPISPPGLDFGTLPPPMGLYSRMESDQDIQALDLGEVSPRLEDLGDLQYIESSSVRESVDRDAAPGEDVPVESVSETRRYSVGLEEVTDEDDTHKVVAGATAKPQAEESQADEPEMVVSEVEDDEDDIRSSVPPADEIDISSVRSEVEPSIMDYVVEEAVTEGRRTEEPEQPFTDDDNAPPVVTEDLATADIQLATQEDEEPVSQHSQEPTESAAEAPTKPEAPATLERTLSSSSNFPPPVSANPNVPDPASLSHTPLSPASPEMRSSSSPTPEGHDATALPANVALHPMFRKLASASHSPSGLFTPLTAENSASVTPERGMPDPAEPAENQSIPLEADQDSPAEPESVPEVAETGAQSPIEAPAGPEDGDPEKQTSLEDEHEAPTETTDEAARREPTPNADVDADADAEGEDDAEYVPTEDVADSSPPEELQATIAPEVEESPQVAEEEAVEVPKQPEEVNGTEDIAHAEAPTPVPNADSTPKATAIELDDKTVPDLDPEARPSSPRESVSSQTDETRPLKRKRKSPTISPQPTRLTRSRSSVQAAQRAFQDASEQKAPKAKKGKGKGKQRAEVETDEEDDASVANSHVSESTSGGSSTAARKMLLPESRGTSRASSVVSNAPSTYSGLSQPSPTIDRILPSNGNLFPPPPFIHNHGILHHHHGRPVAPLVPPVQKRQPSEPPATASEVARRASAEPGPSSQPVLSRAPSTASTSSPVTRSNCRFHMISVPKEEENEDGLRLLFAVPGCALGNAELMKDESIKDLGLVKAEDIPRLIRDLDSCNLSPYLVGVLRQLVGVDLLREQEVFYIPRRGDGVVIKSRKKSHRAKPKKMESISARTLSTASVSRSKEARSMAPPSQASVSTSGESASFAGRLSQRASVATTGSMSGSELSELEDEAPPSKRAKETHPETDSVAGSQPQLPESSSAAPPDTLEESASTASAARLSRKLQPRRSRRLGVDAAAYKPEGGDSDGSVDGEEADTKKRRKRGTKKGLKRTRTEENGENGEAPAEGSTDKPKRRRIRASTANGDKGTPAAAAESAS